MDIKELREQVSGEHIEKMDIRTVLVGLFLAFALVCSLATPFVAQPEWYAFAAIVFLTLGLLCGRALDRRDFYAQSVRRS